MQLSDDEITELLTKWQSERTSLLVRWMAGGRGRLFGSTIGCSLFNAVVESARAPVEFKSGDRGEVVIDMSKAKVESTSHTEIPSSFIVPSDARYGTVLKATLPDGSICWIAEFTN